VKKETLLLLGETRVAFHKEFGLSSELKQPSRISLPANAE
jgi:hypothetical protein